MIARPAILTRLLVLVFGRPSPRLRAVPAAVQDQGRRRSVGTSRVDAGFNIIVLMGAALFFLVTIEDRLKRRRALTALHELRSIVHVIDMHQLTKDPSMGVSVGGTPSSPARTLSRFEITRYLDYCSEMLSLTSKVAVLYAQVFPDPVVTDAVSDIERTTMSLSQKIWQKIMIIEVRFASELMQHLKLPQPMTRLARPRQFPPQPCEIQHNGQRLSADPIALAQALIRCRSVTPDDNGALDVIEHALKPAG
jgi:hypothetical protein